MPTTAHTTAPGTTAPSKEDVGHQAGIIGVGLAALEQESELMDVRLRRRGRGGGGGRGRMLLMRGDGTHKRLRSYPINMCSHDPSGGIDDTGPGKREQ